MIDPRMSVTIHSAVDLHHPNVIRIHGSLYPGNGMTPPVLKTISIAESEATLDKNKALVQATKLMVDALCEPLEVEGAPNEALRSTLLPLVTKAMYRQFYLSHMLGTQLRTSQGVSERERAERELEEFLGMSISDFFEIYGV